MAGAKWLRIALTTLISVGAASVPAAAAVRLTFNDGRVWLVADRATAADILAEWARVGKTRVVNGERIAGPPMTLEMSGVPETQALDVVLRATGGFVAAGRAAGTETAPTVSRLGQITVLPAAGPAPAFAAVAPPPRPPAMVPVPVVTASGAIRIIGADGQPVPDDQEGAPPPPSTTPLPRAPATPPSAAPASTGAAVPGTMPPAPHPTRQ